jgi:excinuclease ABC subunit C
MNDSPSANDSRQPNDLSLLQKIDSLPTKPGVYQFKNREGKVIYVGKAQNLRNRVRQYFQDSRSRESRIEALVSKVVDLELTVTDSEVEALILESNLIKKLKPRYNVDLKDDKSYPYVVITNEPFPRVLVTRKKIGSGARYFGPYTDVKTMRFALKTVRNIFLIRSCNYDLTQESIAKGKFKICLDYHIKKCEGPCEAIVTKDHYSAMIDQVATVLRGRSGSVVDALQVQMDRASSELRFEEAAKLRDRLNALMVYSQKQKVVTQRQFDRDIFAIASKENDACGVIFKVREGKVIGSQHFYLVNAEGVPESEMMETFLERYYLENEDIPTELLLSCPVESNALLESWLRIRANEEVKVIIPKSGEAYKLVAMVKANAQYWIDELAVQRAKRKEIVSHAVTALQRDLRLSSPPLRIECYDISNTQGEDSVASMVVFVDGKPRKSEYRKFKIKGVRGPNDFASMQEVVERRYARALEEQLDLPDLIVVDGGKGQLSSAVEILQKLKLDIPIIGLAKRLEEVFVPNQSEPVNVPRTSSGLRLLQQIRDEAHRFAVTFHRQLRTKRTLQTELDLVKGIGKKRAAELLEVFGSVQGVKFATEEQLSEAVGEKLAAKIKDHFEESSVEAE